MAKDMYDHLRDDSKWDCKHREHCLDLYEYFDSMPCKNCKLYEQEIHVLDAFETRGSYLWGVF